jgi:hypothetical protein
MFTISEKNKNGIFIIKKSFTALFHYKLTGLIAFSIIAINLFIFSTFIDLEYRHYGIHLFDHTTFTELIDLKFWNHIGHFFIILFVLMLSTLITWTFRLILCYIAIQQFSHRQVSVKKIVSIPLENAKELLRASFISSMTFLLNIVDLFSFSTHLTKTTKLAIGEFEENFDEYNTPETLLLIPIMLKENLSLMEALQKAKNILKEKITKHDFSINFSFLYFRSVLICTTISCLVAILHFLLNFHIFGTLISCLITFIALESFITSVTLLFNSAVYNFCDKMPTGPFNENEIKKMFTTR